MIEFNAQFLDGPHAGRIAKLQTPKFAIGLRINVCDVIYRICAGPVARAIERGAASDHLVVNLRVDGGDDPPLSEVGRIDRRGHSE